MSAPLFDNTNQLDFAVTKLGEAIKIANQITHPKMRGLVTRLRNVAAMLDRYKKDRPQ